VKSSAALARLLDYALAGAPESERVHVYDFASVLGQDVAREDRRALREIGKGAASVAAALRGAETLELNFRRKLPGQKGEA